ncbi:PTS glucose transporter subunit IIA, partial [Coprobacillus cateniformis]|nr:PTS glucose transporter subunit IIA [Coprobacillus cateniformis]
SYNQKQVQLEGYDTTIMVIVTNSKKYDMNCCYGYDISEGEKIINIK